MSHGFCGISSFLSNIDWIPGTHIQFCVHEGMNTMHLGPKFPDCITTPVPWIFSAFVGGVPWGQPEQQQSVRGCCYRHHLCHWRFEGQQWKKIHKISRKCLKVALNFKVSLVVFHTSSVFARLMQGFFVVGGDNCSIPFLIQFQILKLQGVHSTRMSFPYMDLYVRANPSDAPAKKYHPCTEYLGIFT